MNQQTEQPDTTIPDLQQEKKSPTSSSANSNRKIVSRGRLSLLFLAFAVIIVIVVGIIFGAHQFYHEFGGQGFLKVRDKTETLESVETNVLLPSRMIETFNKECKPSSSLTKRSRGNVPFFTCGDQQESCEHFGQPNICCPIHMVCKPSRFSTSNILCCNSTALDSACKESLLRPPQCSPSTFECSAATGGGCCPEGLICSPNGCIRIKGPSIIGPCSSHSSASNTNSMVGSSTTINTVVTVTESPASTATLAKEGEVAQKGVGVHRSMVLGLCVPYLSAWMLVIIAILMVML